MRVFEAFAGVGSQRMALRNIGIKHDVVAIAEIDGFAIKSYMAIHGDTPNLGDISQLTVDQIPDHDLFTYSFPCQDISIAGQNGGLSEGSGTRSSLLWECKRVIEGKRPKYLLLENVKNIIGANNKPDFDKWLLWLESQGYKSYWNVLNAKDFGVPQSRDRVFVVSILQDGQLQLFDEFDFPVGTESTIPIHKLGEVSKNSQAGAVYDINGLCPTLMAGTHGYAMGYIKDNGGDPTGLAIRNIMEQNIPEKYFLSKEVQDRFVYKPQGSNIVGSTAPENKKIGQRDRVYDPDRIAPTLESGDFRQPKQILVEGTIEFPGNGTYKHEQSRRVYNTEGIAPTLPTSCGGGQHIKVMNDARIRRLTPREYWRLMGFSDSDFDKTRFQSDTQLYKQAGNSIVVPVLEAIFTQMFKGAI